MNPKYYSTGDAAKAVGISRVTLQAWIAKGKITAPEAQDFGKVRVRLWTLADIARLREQKRKIYKKELGRPSKNGRK
jgi:excisionase family DNA binding protein